MDIENKIAHRFKDTENAFYSSHEKVYSREISGTFQTLRKLAAFILLGGFYLAAWVNWDGHQALLFDLPNRQFYILGLTFWPQDFFFLAWLLIIAALSLFFFTALAGRLWCGYACPQTVWTEVFIWFERLIEGNRNAQIKLTKMPWNAEKIRKRVLKQVVWIVFAFWTGFTFVGYFTPIRELGASLIDSISGTYVLGPWETFWILFYGFATYGNAGYLREQVCLYMCPYARFQSAMFDKDTLVISYDAERGEPRTKGKMRKETGKEIGDCIDCELCVQVCPTGIDIREGLQYECIGCAACVDACHDVMTKTKQPTGLIRYTTENTLDHKQSHVVRPRILFYAGLLTVICITYVIALFMRTPLSVDIIRDRAALYRVVDGEHIENVFNFKVMNKSNQAQFYEIQVTNLASASIVSEQTVPVEPGEVGNIPVAVTASVTELKNPVESIEFEISAKIEGKTISVNEVSRFISPK